MLKRSTKLSLYQAMLYGLIFFSSCNTNLHAAEPRYDGYIIDAYSMLDKQMKDPEVIIKAMDDTGVKKVILSAIGKQVWERLESFGNKHPDRVLIAFKTTFRGFFENKPGFSRVMANRIANHNYKAIGEAFVYKKWFDDSVIDVPMTDDRIISIVEEAKSNGWPALLHINTKFMDSNKRQQYLGQLDSLLEEYPDVNFGLTQKAWLSINQTRYLVERHNNVYFLLSNTTPESYEKTYEELLKEGKTGARRIFQGGSLKPDWQNLFEKYPTRFLMSFYAIGDLDWGDHYGNQVKWWRYALGHLRPATADAMAHGNAERLWNISN